jgi:aspartyl/asparaginyl beta-hydroxylase (cupin superfamily)
LIETDNWLSLHLLKGGKRVEPNASDMPVTMAALQSIELPDCAGNAPEAFFSTLAPQTHIPPHYGLANFKLTAHLALNIPDDCGIRAGGRTRGWHPGRCLFFDDSFLHEAWNRSGRHRTVLIFDVWHPELTAIEKSALTRLFGPVDASFNYRLSGLG